MSSLSRANRVDLPFVKMISSLFFFFFYSCHSFPMNFPPPPPPLRPPCEVLLPCECRQVNMQWSVVCSAVSNLSTLYESLPSSMDLPWISVVDSDIPFLGPLAFASLRANSLQINASNMTGISADAFAGTIEESLSRLIIQDNALRQVPVSALRRLVNLHLLSFAGNEISSIHRDDFTFLPHLRYLSLSENRIESIEADSFPPSLLHLAMTSNHLSTLGDAMSGLVKLRWLTISNNSLTSFDSQLEPLSSSLNLLSASYNRLESVHGVFKGFNKLRQLFLHHNQFRSVDGAFDSMLQLKTLDVSNNLIQRLGQLGQLPSLTELDVSQNSIDHIDSDAFAFTPNINRLNLSSNDLSHFPGEALSLLRHLVVLDLSRNRLPSLEGISHLYLPVLKHFYVSGNKLTSLPPSLSQHLPSLLEFDVTYNVLNSLDAGALVQLPLRILHIKGNPLRCDASTLTALQKIDQRVDDMPRCSNAVLPDSEETK